MIQEKKTFKIIYRVYDINDIIYHRESFGWKTIGFNSTLVNMGRSVNVQNLLYFKSIEEKYDKALYLYNEYKQASIISINKFILAIYILLIVPGIIYFGNKLIMRYKAQGQIKKIDRIIKDARFIS